MARQSKEGALLILRGAHQTREWVLGERTEIGREETCAICLMDRQVSRVHAVVESGPDGYVVKDAGSKNGTWVNGVPVDEPIRLQDGDEVSIAARYKLYFVDAEATAPLVFEARGLGIDEDSMTVYVNGQVLEPPLSGPQYALLLMLYRAGGAVVTRQEIIDHVWPEAEAHGVSEDAVDALIRRLRKRIDEVEPDHSYIVTVRGHGYRLSKP